MNRRTFLAKTIAGMVGTAASQWSVGSASETASNEPAVLVTIDPLQTLAVIPPDFMGLGYEISSVARPALLSAQNAVYVQLVRTLGKNGVIRIGGNTADYATYQATGRPLSAPEGEPGSVVNDAVLRDLGTFLDATGWKLIWALNLGNGAIENAILEAKAVTAAVNGNLLAFEIGNEPDLFPSQLPGHDGHRPAGYGYNDYLREYRQYRDALRKALPDISFAGPDSANAADWVGRFAADEGKDIKLLTHHYYREGQNPTSTIEKLLNTDPKLTPVLAKLRIASESFGVPYRICETNSFSGGGKPGVSDTLASALWALDFMFTLAAAGCAGVNMETGVNQHGFISSYSPIEDDENGHYWASPEYYGMLAFAQSGMGRVLRSTMDAKDKNIKGYATQLGKSPIVLTIINKEPSLDATISLGAASPFRRGSLVRLSGPSLDSKSGVNLRGASVLPTGLWKPDQTEEISATRGGLQIRLPAASAAIVALHS